MAGFGGTGSSNPARACRESARPASSPALSQLGVLMGQPGNHLIGRSALPRTDSQLVFNALQGFGHGLEERDQPPQFEENH